MANKAIAQEVGLSRAMVVQRRQRFWSRALKALQDAPRSGKKPTYDRDTERRILALLDTDSTSGIQQLDGNTGCASVGGCLFRPGLASTQAARYSSATAPSWCVSTDPEFTQKAADIVGLYLDLPRCRRYQRGREASHSSA